ncbi:MAG TPA: FKBP-type peptidyl-prolyl cis-trans isomerase, partial [Chitinophagaceae bacterium]|nr:FKBP-type peptidyl-prolyl cis-trans isomerase [Chitinophagaceae bacterium]
MIKLNFKQTLRDSVLQETYSAVPGYALVDSVGPVYNAAELFPKLRKGDSLVVVLLGDSIIKKFGPQQGIKKEDQVKLHFKILDIFATTEAATADRNNEFSKQKDRQAKAFTDYMAKHQGAQKTAAGTYVEVTSQGTGPQVQPGKLIAVKYSGKLIPSEKPFESNMEGQAPPYEFIVGSGTVIRGWEDGLTMFKEGGRGKLYIPYELAYGEQQGPGGLPYQPLMFDIEVVSVKDAPKGMPQGQQPFIPERLPADT